MNEIMQDSVPTPYSTNSEKEFIDGIGKGEWSKHKIMKKYTRLKLLNKYMNVLMRRHDFGEINEQVAIQCLHEAILKEKALQLKNISGQ